MVYSSDAEPLAPTGFSTLDNNAVRNRAPRALTGLSLLKDPTEFPKTARLFLQDSEVGKPFDLKEIEKAYNVDSFIQQAIDKYFELCTKHGWYLDCETPEPVEYLLYRFKVMGMMTGKTWNILADEIVQDVITFSNGFLVKKRQIVEEDPLLPTQGVGGKQLPVAGYFRADPKLMSPYWSKDGKKFLGWKYTSQGNGVATKPVIFPRQDVVHFTFNVRAGTVWGRPGILAALEDVRQYRQCEEYVLRLLYKHLHPLLHHEVPDNSGMGLGRQEDVDSAQAAHSVIAPDGLIVTPPGHKINYIGAESHAIRGEGYMELLKSRVYAGLGVNQLVMGEGSQVTTGSSDVMTASMHNRAKLYQRHLGEQFTEYILCELLMEGGYDPLSRLDYVRWAWVDIETEARLAKENHTIQKWTNNLLTQDEARQELGKKPIPEDQQQSTFVYQVVIPELDAQADAKSRAQPSGEGAKRQSNNRARPRNQWGTRPAPKIRPV